MKRKVKIIDLKKFPLEVYGELLEKIYDPETAATKRRELPSLCYSGNVFVLFENKVPISTCTLFINETASGVLKNSAFVGFFETVTTKCEELFRSMEEFAISRGIERLIGPVNGSTWETYRYMEPSDHPLFLTESYHPAMYPEIWKKNGFEPMSAYWSALDLTMDDQDEKTKSRLSFFQKMGIQVRTIDLDRYEEELQKIHAFSAKAFADNFLYTPIPLDRFKEKYLPLKELIDPAFVILLEDSKKELVGLNFCLPNKFNTNKKQLIVKTLARSLAPEYRGLGLVLSTLFMKAAKSQGYESVVHAFMHEKNISTNISKNFNGQIIRKYLVYSKQIKR